jgi:hypothetical protein
LFLSFKKTPSKTLTTKEHLCYYIGDNLIIRFYARRTQSLTLALREFVVTGPFWTEPFMGFLTFSRCASVFYFPKKGNQ